MFPAEHRALRELHATTRQLAGHWAKLGDRLGLDTDAFPLSAYKDSSFYTMRTDALDRFGTRLEHRFSRTEIETLMSDAGLEQVRFSEGMPYWVAVGRRRAS